MTKTLLGQPHISHHTVGQDVILSNKMWPDLRARISKLLAFQSNLR